MDRQNANLDSWLEIGFINRPRGLKGEVIATITSNTSQRLVAGSKIQAESRQLILKSAKPHKGVASESFPDKSRSRKFVFTFEDISTREDAECLRGKKLTAPAMAPGKTAEGELWVHQLVGCEVLNQNGKSCGIVKEVEANPASDLLVLSSNALIPARFISSFEHGVIVVDIPAGLLDIQNTEPDTSASSDSTA